MAGHTGNAEEARRLLADPDPSVRAAALGALVRLDSVTPADTSTAAGDPSPAVRRRLCELAGELPQTDFLPLLEDSDDRVLEAACFACGEQRAEAAVTRLAEIASSHGNHLCRESAVAALGAIGDGRGLPAVLAGLGDKATVRRRAVIALAAFEGAEVDSALAAALGDRDWQVRQAAEDLAGHRDTTSSEL